MKVKRKIGAGCGFKAAIKTTKNTLKKNIGRKNLVKLATKCVVAAKEILHRFTKIYFLLCKTQTMF